MSGPVAAVLLAEEALRVLMFYSTVLHPLVVVLPRTRPTNNGYHDDKKIIKTKHTPYESTRLILSYEQTTIIFSEASPSLNTILSFSHSREPTGRSPMPQGTMCSKCPRSGRTLSDSPCMVTHRFTRTPTAYTQEKPHARK